VGAGERIKASGSDGAGDSDSSEDVDSDGSEDGTLEGVKERIRASGSDGAADGASNRKSLQFDRAILKFTFDMEGGVFRSGTSSSNLGSCPPSPLMDLPLMVDWEEHGQKFVRSRTKHCKNAKICIHEPFATKIASMKLILQLSPLLVHEGKENGWTRKMSLLSIRRITRVV
jgi:hypothetical protein